MLQQKEMELALRPVPQGGERSVPTKKYMYAAFINVSVIEWDIC